MIVKCSCSQVQARIDNFPKNTPGRLVCYCDDCQNFLKQINRTELLDECGGSEIIPVYPKDVKIIKGVDKLECIRLTDKGLFRWYTSCCKTPFGNTRPGFPWLGFLSEVYEESELKQLGPIRSRVCGKFAITPPPAGTPDNMKFQDILVVIPFLLKGFILKKSSHSPFFMEDNKTPISSPHIIKS